MTIPTNPAHQASCGILGLGARASSRLLAAGQQAAASRGTCLLPGTSRGSFGCAAAFAEDSSMKLMGGRRGQRGLRGGAGRMHRVTLPAGLSSGSPETLPVIAACVRQIAVDTRPPAAAPTATCPPAASRPPGSALAAQRPRLPPAPPPPCRACPTDWRHLESFYYNLRAELSKGQRS